MSESGLMAEKRQNEQGTALSLGSASIAGEAASAPRAGGEAPGRGRLPWIDWLRGLAIVIMIPANMSATLLVEPHPFWFRVASSFAAPLFVFLAGMMVGFSVRSKHQGFGHAVARGAWLLFWAGLQDILIWSLWPGTTMDVLYLLGVSLPVAWVAMRLPMGWRPALALGLFILPHGLRAIWGYEREPSFYLLMAQRSPLDLLFEWRQVVYNWTVTGDFPLAPWLGFTLLGAWAADWRWGPAPSSFQEGRLPQVAGLLLVIGLGLWWAWPGEQYTRVGYSELFYPAVIGYLLFTTGLLGLLLVYAEEPVSPGPVDAPRPPASDDASYGLIGRWLCRLGEAALLLYVAHGLLIKFVLTPWFGALSMGPFLLLAVAFIGLFVVLTAWILPPLRRRFPRPPLPLRMLLGG